MLTHLGKTGFTLIELMVVITVVAILVSISIPIMRLQHEKAKLAEVISSMGSVSTSLYHYYEDYNYFPSINDGVGILNTLGVGVPFGMSNSRIASIRIQNGSIICTLNNISSKANGEELILVPTTDATTGVILWDWDGSAGLPKSLLPIK
jgi:prepilin-type N-terminal cleavage/methylation domain-containing protein